MIRFILLVIPFSLLAETAIPIFIEHATTIEARRKGLMHRSHLDPNHGMLLHYPESGYHRIWMYNCLIPLSVAFIDENGAILEIHELKAHPELVNNTQNLNHLDYNDPTVKLFLSESVKPNEPVKYSLEMNGGWFQNHGVSQGDRVKWCLPAAEAKVLLRK